MLFLSCQSGCCLRIGSDLVCVLLLFAAWGVIGSDVVHVSSSFAVWGVIGSGVVYVFSSLGELSALA